MAHYEWSNNSLPSAEDKAYDFLEQVLDENSITSPAREKIRLVVAEAVTNAISHGNKFSPHKQVKIVLDINDSTLTADVMDEGDDGLEQIENRKKVELLSESGRGVDLINHYCAKASYENIPTGGTKVSLVFDLEKEKVNQE